jgi:short subunit dehydrogenase-like uncharacterized protein
MSILLYGANGYTGELVARRAAALGLPPSTLILGGRRAKALAPLGAELGFERRAFSLERPEEIGAALAGVKVVLSCAGPFSHTAKPLVDACLRARVHYLDITGEIEVFEALWARDAEARAAGVMLLPGAGFDVVPSDCLAAHLAARLPSATHLRLALSVGGRMSRGTALTSIEGAGAGGLVRRDGALTRVPFAHETIRVDFGDGPVAAVAIPWGDVFTAYVTTGIPNIEVYVAVPPLTRTALRAARFLGPVLAAAPVRRFLAARVRAGAAGPSAEQRREGRSRLWGEARDGTGRVATARLMTPEPYELTSILALELAQRALAGDAPPGYRTPARAYGRDPVLGFPGVSLEKM